MSGDDLDASLSKELCTKKESYCEKDDMTTGILVVESQRIYVSKEVRQPSHCELTYTTHQMKQGLKQGYIMSKSRLMVKNLL